MEHRPLRQQEQQEIHRQPRQPRAAEQHRHQRAFHRQAKPTRMALEQIIRDGAKAMPTDIQFQMIGFQQQPGLIVVFGLMPYDFPQIIGVEQPGLDDGKPGQQTMIPRCRSAEPS